MRGFSHFVALVRTPLCGRLASSPRGFGRSRRRSRIERQALLFATSDDATAPQRSAHRGDHRMLALAVAVVVIENDPVPCFSNPMSPRGIRIKRRVLTRTAPRVKHRQPRVACWVEATRRDQTKLTAGGLLAVFAIDVEQLGDWKSGWTCWRKAHAPEAVRQRIPNASQSFFAKTGDRLQAPVVRRRFEVSQRLESELVVKSSRQAPSDSRHRGEECHRIRFPTQAVEHRKPAMHQQLANRASDGLPDTRELLKTVETLLPKKDVQRYRRGAQRCRRVSIGVNAIWIGALITKESCGLLESPGDLLVYGLSHYFRH